VRCLFAADGVIGNYYSESEGKSIKCGRSWRGQYPVMIRPHQIGILRILKILSSDMAFQERWRIKILDDEANYEQSWPWGPRTCGRTPLQSSNQIRGHRSKCASRGEQDCRVAVEN